MGGKSINWWRNKSMVLFDSTPNKQTEKESEKKDHNHNYYLNMFALHVSLMYPLNDLLLKIKFDFYGLFY